jgi:hypothetical protein
MEYIEKIVSICDIYILISKYKNYLVFLGWNYPNKFRLLAR